MLMQVMVGAGNATHTCMLACMLQVHTHTHTHQFFIQVNVGLPGLEPDDTEHHNGGEDGGGRVDEADDEGVCEGIVVRLGVAG